MSYVGILLYNNLMYSSHLLVQPVSKGVRAHQYLKTSCESDGWDPAPGLRVNLPSLRVESRSHDICGETNWTNPNPWPRSRVHCKTHVTELTVGTKLSLVVHKITVPDTCKSQETSRLTAYSIKDLILKIVGDYSAVYDLAVVA